MFERFYRGPRSGATTTGSGLGLWIAQAFVAACGGRLEAASQGAGQGHDDHHAAASPVDRQDGRAGRDL